MPSERLSSLTSFPTQFRSFRRHRSVCVRCQFAFISRVNSSRERAEPREWTWVIIDCQQLVTSADVCLSVRRAHRPPMHWSSVVYPDHQLLKPPSAAAVAAGRASRLTLTLLLSFPCHVIRPRDCEANWPRYFLHTLKLYLAVQLSPATAMGLCVLEANQTRALPKRCERLCVQFRGHR